jgi:hypothetical protein
VPAPDAGATVGDGVTGAATVGAGVPGAAVGAGVGVAAAVGAGVTAAVGAGVTAEEAAVVGLTVVVTSSSSPPQPWIAKKALNARRESTNARPVILKIANSHS